MFLLSDCLCIFGEHLIDMDYSNKIVCEEAKYLRILVKIDINTKGNTNEE